jgi:hypothetical protein
MTKLPVINLLGGPGSGKSTTAALVYGKLKQLGWNVEMAREYAKDCCWRGSFNTLTDQVYILGKQNHKLHYLVGQVDCAITDSPILLGCIYNKTLTKFDDLVLELFNQYENFNYVITRTKEYNPSGRMQTEEEAKEIDKVTVGVLNKFGIPYKHCSYGDKGVDEIVFDIIMYMNHGVRE